MWDNVGLISWLLLPCGLDLEEHIFLDLFSNVDQALMKDEQYLYNGRDEN